MKTKGKSENGISFRKIRNVASTEYIKWIVNPRIIVFVAMYIFMYDYIFKEIIEGMDKMGDKAIMILEPFIAMANNNLINLILPSVFLVLISDFPKTDGNTMFYIQRTGKLNWMFGQIMFAFTAIITYLTSIVYVSFLIMSPRCYSKNVWSTLTTGYAKMFPEESNSLVANMINGRLYNNVTPSIAFISTIILLAMFLMLIAVFLLVGFSAGKRTLSMASSCLVIAVGSGLCKTESKIKWLFPSSNSLLEMHFDRVLKKQIVNIRNSYLYFIIILLTLFIISCIAIKRYDFSKITEVVSSKL